MDKLQQLISLKELNIIYRDLGDMGRVIQFDDNINDLHLQFPIFPEFDFFEQLKDGIDKFFLYRESQLGRT